MYLIVTVFCQKTIEVKEIDTDFEGIIQEYIWNESNDSVMLTLQNPKETFLIQLHNTKKESVKNIIQYGTKIKGMGTIQIPLNNTIPNTFNYKKYLQSKKIKYWIEANQIFKVEKGNIIYLLKQKIRENLDQRENSYYYKMLILGVKEKEKEEIQDLFRKNGISHVFVISGLHLACIYKLCNRLGKKVIKNKKIQYFFPIIILTIYYFLITKTISSFRAYTFFMLTTINKIGNFSVPNKKIFLYTLGITIFLKPFAIFQIGFWYSYIISFALIFFSISKEKKHHKIKNSILIFLIALPITINSSFTINPWIIINNLLIVPIITFLLFPCLIVTTIFSFLEPLTNQLIWLIEKYNIICSNLIFSDLNASKIPLILLIMYYSCIFAYFYSWKNIFLLFLGMLIFIYINYPKWNSNGYIYFLDVGQGDSTLIISPHQKETILIDTGVESKTNQNKMIQFFKSIGITKIDYLILSHGDNDHIGNAINLLDNFKISYVLLNNGGETELETKIKRKYPHKIINNFNSKYIKVNELKHKITIDENDNSRILNICLYKTCTLFMGDASKAIEEEITNKYNLSSNILKVGHHGSNTSTSETLLKSYSFKEAIISAGRKNRYHHPHKEVITNLKKFNINIWNTQSQGTIKCKINQKSYTLSYSKP